MICDIVELKNFLKVADDKDSNIIDGIHEGVEKAIKKEIGWEPEEVIHVNKLYDGTGSDILFLDELYISSVIRTAYKTTGIKIKNTSIDATNAYITITTTTMTLVVVGGTNNDSTALSLTTYSTLTLLVTAINAIGKGWVASIYDTDYASYKSTNMIPVTGFFCGSWDGVTATDYYLDMAGQPISGIELYDTQGAVYSPSRFGNGRKNIVVSYTGGYTAASMPNDLQLAVKMGVKYQFQKHGYNAEGVKSFTIGDLRMDFGGAGSGDSSSILSNEVMVILAKYKKVLV